MADTRGFSKHFSGRFLLINLVGIAWYGVVLYQFFPVNGALDHRLIAPWVTAQGVFFERGNWWLTHIAHQAVKQLIIGILLVLLVQFAGSFYKATWRSYRWSAGYVLCTALLSTLLVSLLKSQSAHACPWNLVQVQQQHLVWLDHLAHAGHCFPGGHASAGFGLIALFFAYWSSQPKKALLYLLATLVLGFAMGWGQMMRGAHFLSHNLWTLWVCWAVNLLGCGLVVCLDGVKAHLAQQKISPKVSSS